MTIIIFLCIKGILCLSNCISCVGVAECFISLCNHVMKGLTSYLATCAVLTTATIISGGVFGVVWISVPNHNNCLLLFDARREVAFQGFKCNSFF